MAAVPSPHDNWKSLLLAGRVEADHVRQFAAFLAAVYRCALGRTVFSIASKRALSASGSKNGLSGASSMETPRRGIRKATGPFAAFAFRDRHRVVPVEARPAQ